MRTMVPNAISLPLNDDEFEALMVQPDPASRSEGGFQRLLLTLQDNTDPNTKILVLPVHLIEKINRYAFDYGQGEWERTLKRIFSRSLGDGLDQIPK
jgi:hypothetical protein